MFGERDALKIRLEQLLVMEEKTLRMFKEERKEIFDRLRELDRNKSEFATEEITGETTLSQQVKTNLDGPNRTERANFLDSGAETENGASNTGIRKKSVILREAAIELLKRSSTAVPLHQIKHELESKTGIEVKNISLFMINLVKKEENIKKATHGQYMYTTNQR